MTKSEKEYIDQAEELAALKAVEKMKQTLQCVSHGNDLIGLSTTVGDNKNHIKENRKHIHNDRKIFLSGIAVIILGEIVMKIFL